MSHSKNPVISTITGFYLGAATQIRTGDLILTDEQRGALDFARYDAAIAALGEDHTPETLDGETLAELIASAANGDTVTLSNHYYVASTITINKTLTLNLNGKEIEYKGESGSVFEVVSGGNLTLTGNGQITGGKGSNISTYSTGGGVYVNGGTFTMNGGTIINCNADSGGGVYVNGGTFTMNGGTITNCTAYIGGGVYACDSSIQISAGTITGCNSLSDHGGGINANRSDFTMSGGEIKDCSSRLECKDVYLDAESDAKTFTMTGGTIGNNNGETAIIMYKINMKPQGGTVNGAVKLYSSSTIALGETTSSSPAIFNGAVTSSSSCTISAGIYNGVVTNESGTINGGTFNGGIVGGTVNIEGQTVETFDADGGEPATQTLTFKTSENGTPATGATFPIATPNKEGHEFLGWYLTEDESQYTYQGKVHNESITYKAKWSPRQYTVTWDANGGTFGESDKTTDTLAYGSDITPPTANPTKSASDTTVYTFDGWYTEKDSGEEVKDFGKLEAADVTYYAHWTSTPRQYTVTWDANGGTLDTTGATHGEVATGTAIVAPTATRAADAQYTYTFDGWYLVGEDGAETKVTDFGTATANVTYKAHWTQTLRQYTVTWDANGGTLDTTGATGTANYGTVITPPTANPTKTDAQYTYTFDGWYDAQTGGNKLTASTTLAGNVTYYAHWTQGALRQYTLSFNSNGGTDVSPITADYGTVIDVSNIKPYCYGCIFTGWYTDATFKTRVTNVTLTEETTLVAGWVLNTYVGPHTGDDSNLALWLALLTLSTAALTTTATVLKKKRKG